MLGCTHNGHFNLGALWQRRDADTCSDRERHVVGHRRDVRLVHVVEVALVVCQEDLDADDWCECVVQSSWAERGIGP